MLNSIPAGLGIGAGSLDALKGLLTEVQGLTISLLTGAASGTKINLAAIRSEDTIIASIENNAGALTDHLSATTIVDTHATGTLTAAAVEADDVCVVNGVTYTFKATPTAKNHVNLTSGNNNANAAALATTINAYENRRISDSVGFNQPEVVATASSAVVTITAVEDGAAGNAITLTGTAVRLAASGSGTLADGSDTGGIKIAADTSSHQVLVFWFNKNP